MKLQWSLFLTLLILPFSSHSSSINSELTLTNSTVGYAALIIFAIAYALVMLEEYLQLRKSKPVLLAAGIIWAMLGYVYSQNGQIDVAKAAPVSYYTSDAADE